MMQRRRTRRLLCWAAVSALAAAGTAPAFAQDQGPTVFTRREQRPLFSLEPIRGDLEFLYRGQRDDRKDKASGTNEEFSEDRFEETLTLRSTGAIYHPNLVFLDLEGTFGLFQEQVSGDASENQNGTLYAWDANATILRNQDIVPSLYTRRTRQLVTRQFGPAFDSTLTSTGAILDIRNKAVPTRFEISHTTEEQTALDDETGDFELSQDTFQWHSEYRPTQRQTVTWDYSYNKIDQSSGSLSNHFDSHDATLSHSAQFGLKDRSSLNSTLHYFKQGGDFPVQQFRWDELLRLRHTDNFETRYQYTLDQQTFGNTDQTTQRGTAGFTHQLYKSLTTDGSIGVEDITRSDDSDTFAYFADLSFDYRKLVPLGRLNLFTNTGFRHEDNQARTGTSQVINVAHVVSDVQPIVIVGPGISPQSVVVTDPSGLLLYLPGADYTVSPFPNRIEINRVIGGRIGAGDTVLIDYQLPPQPKNETTTTSFSLGGRYDIDRGMLRGLGVYARYAQQDQSITSAQPTALVDNSFKDLMVGADYKFWLMQVGAEREWHDSTIVPFEATRYWARFKTAVGSHTDLMLNSAYDIINYTEENNETKLLTVSSTLSHQFTQQFYGVATVLWRKEENQSFGNTTGWEEQIQLQWRHRQTYVYGLVRNSNLETEQTSNTFQLFEIGLRREF